jgi:hypothetical protein
MGQLDFNQLSDQGRQKHRILSAQPVAGNPASRSIAAGKN